MPDHTNPGTVNPASQGFPPPSQPPPPPSSAPLKSSDGEIQQPAVGPAWARPSHVRGLPSEVSAASASQVRRSTPELAPSARPSVNVNASSQKPGTGLPVNVVIK